MDETVTLGTTVYAYLPWQLPAAFFNGGAVAFNDPSGAALNSLTAALASLAGLPCSQLGSTVMPSGGPSGSGGGGRRSAGNGLGEGSNGGQPTAGATQKCAGASVRKNAVSLGLDAAGLIPGEGIAAEVLQIGVGVVSAVSSAIGRDTTGAFGGIAGIQLTALAPAARKPGRNLAKSIPVIGTVLNVGPTGRDLYGAYDDYQPCLAGR